MMGTTGKYIDTSVKHKKMVSETMGGIRERALFEINPSQKSVQHVLSCYIHSAF